MLFGLENKSLLMYIDEYAGVQVDILADQRAEKDYKNGSKRKMETRGGS